MLYYNSVVHSAGQTYTQQTKEKQTMYIKTYRESSQVNFKVMQAENVGITEVFVDTIELQNKWVANREDEILSYNAYLIEEILQKAFPQKIINMEHWDTFYNMNNPNSGAEKTEDSPLGRTFTVIQYEDKDGEIRYFIPCSRTYLLNNNGSTITTIK